MRLTFHYVDMGILAACRASLKIKGRFIVIFFDARPRLFREMKFHSDWQRFVNKSGAGLGVLSTLPRMGDSGGSC